MKLHLSVILFAFAMSHASASDPCNLSEPCQVEGGDYYLALPEDWDRKTPRPAIVFFHGHNSSGKSVINSSGIRDAFIKQGYVLIAPNGAQRARDGVRAWPARPMDGNWRDDVALTRAIVEDVATRLPIDRDKVVVSGFSAGGSMAWMIACYDGQAYSGFISVAGALRRPIPDETCPAGPVRLLHIHGFSDRQVPLEGRAIGNWHQGDVHQSLDLLRRTNQCISAPSDVAIGDRYRCRVWNSCGGGADIELCMHDGGHGLPSGWGEIARTWFEGSGPASAPATQ